MQRTIVDLPEPERPMMMKISPTSTSKLTLHAAPMWPDSMMRAWSASGASTSPLRAVKKLSGSLPYIFQTLRQEILISPPAGRDGA